MDITNSLNESFVTVFLNIEHVSFPNKCENICIDTSFEVVDVRDQLENLNVNKSVGVDKVHPYVLKECSVSLSQSLYRLFSKNRFTAVLYQMSGLLRLNIHYLKKVIN
jgi:hypothetical protein